MRLLVKQCAPLTSIFFRDAAMKLLLTFIAKEFKHILRDPRTLLILFGMPIIQIFLFGFALSTEVKNANIAILDETHDEASRLLTERLQASEYFTIVRTIQTSKDIEQVFRTGSAKLVVVFPAGFRESLLHTNRTSVQLIADASDPNVATTLVNYATAIINDYQQGLQFNRKLPYSIVVEPRMLYNPQMEGSYNFVPGVMAVVLMLICVLMTSISIVREKELSTMEILLVSPMQPRIVLIAKMIPYLVLSMGIVTMILLLSVFVLHVPIRGSVLLLFIESFLFVVVCLAIGLIISNFTNTQVVAMLVALMAMMLPTVMLSGFMFPIENFPLPIKFISNILPSKWYFFAVKNIMIKGLPFSGVLQETAVLFGMAVLFMVVGVRTFKTRLS